VFAREEAPGDKFVKKREPTPNIRDWAKARDLFDSQIVWGGNSGRTEQQRGVSERWTRPRWVKDQQHVHLHPRGKTKYRETSGDII